MPFKETEFPGLYLFEPRVFGDERGYFFESYSERTFRKAGQEYHFVQDNEAKSAYGVVRGFHYQKPPHAQGKLIRAVEGVILDVLLDIRKGSPTFGKVFQTKLSAENKKQILVPRGFAHGYAALTQSATVLYKCDGLYEPSAEGAISFDDSDLHIDWQIPRDKIIISEKDKELPRLKEIDSPFIFEEES